MELLRTRLEARNEALATAKPEDKDGGMRLKDAG